MDNKTLLRVVIRESSNEGSPGFRIDNSKADPSLVYYDPDEVEEKRVITINNDDEISAVTCDELTAQLRSRNYNHIGSRRIQFFTDDNDVMSTNLCMVTQNSSGKEYLYPIVSSTTTLNYCNIMSLQSELLKDEFSDTLRTLSHVPESTLEYYEHLVDLIKKDGTENETDMKNYYNFSIIRDFVENSTTVNVLSMLKENYVDTINLNTVRSLITFDSDSEKSLGISIKLGVQYTTESGIVTGQDLIFDAYKDYHHTINDELVIEIKDNCIRLFPSDSVVESIITYCYLQYDGIL